MHVSALRNQLFNPLALSSAWRVDLVICMQSKTHLLPACRNEVQKWELYTACLEHLRLVVSALQPGMVQALPGTQAAAPPGLSVMMELLRESSSPASLQLSSAWGVSAVPMHAVTPDDHILCCVIALACPGLLSMSDVGTAGC